MFITNSHSQRPIPLLHFQSQNYFWRAVEYQSPMPWLHISVCREEHGGRTFGGIFLFEAEDVQTFLIKVSKSADTRVLDIQFSMPIVDSSDGVPTVRQLQRVILARRDDEGSETLIYETQEGVHLSNPSFDLSVEAQWITLYDCSG
ncbi:hypothetical protein NG726_20340 [Pseudomonas sp. MOB-449]|nr:hypothetical protein [Pseudomonas sp. MOB-449]